MFVLAKQGVAQPFWFSIMNERIKQSTKCSIVYDGVNFNEERLFQVNPYLMIEVSMLPSKALTSENGSMTTTAPSLQWNVVFGL